MKFKKEILPLALLLGIVLVFFYRTVIFGLLPVPADALNGMYYPWRQLYAQTNPNGIPFKNFLITDPVRQQIPWRKIVVDQWKEGLIPGWNQYNLGGYSLAGNIQAAPFFPGNLLFLVFDFPVSWSALIILSHLIAAWGMYFFGRVSGFSRLASTLGAVAYAFSGFMVSWSQWGTIVWVAAFIPFVLTSINRYFRQSSVFGQLSWIFLAAIFLALSFLSGHTQIFLYGLVLVFFYALSISIRIKSNSSKSLILFFGLLSLVFGLLTWFQLMPVAVQLLSSARFTGLEPRPESWFFPWQHLVQFLAPDFFGNPATLNYRGVWNYGEFNGYIGITVLVFSFTALFAKKVRNRFFRWVILAAVIGMTVNPVTIFIDRLNLPFLSSLQSSRLVYLAVFSLVVLGMEGFDRAFMSKAKSNYISWLGTGVVLGWLLIMAVVFAGRGNGGPEDHWLVTRRNLILPVAVYLFSAALYFLSVTLSAVKLTRLFRLAIVTLVAFDLFRMGWKFLPFTPQAMFFPETELTDFLKNNQGPYLTASVDPEVFPPNTASYYGVRTLEGYDSLVPERIEEFTAAAARGVPDIRRPFGFNRIVASQSPGSPLYEIAGVKWVLSRNELTNPDLTFVTNLDSVNIYETASPSARYYLARYLDFAESKETVMAKLFTGFIPGKSAVLETIVELPYEGLGVEEVRVLRSGPGFWEFEVEVSEDRIFVLNETYDRSWTAEIDKRPTEIIRANYVFQAVIVPAGQHRIVFRYNPI